MPSPTSDDLIFAVRFSAIEKIKALLAQGADINGKDSVGNTALIYAASKDVEAARLLLDNGARIDETNKWGDTALIRAVDWNNSPDMVRFLLDRGASTDIKNRSGYTAESMAAAKGRSAIVKMIQEVRRERDRLAAEKARLEAARKLTAERQQQLKKIKPSPFRPK
jgi:ankyrin repeat protein